MVNRKEGQKIIKVSWQQYDERIESLAKIINNRTIVPLSLIGISRGGMIVAVSLSHILKTSRQCRPDVYAVRRPFSIEQITLHYNDYEAFKRFGALFVDDIIDSGRTALKLVQVFGADIKIVSLHYKPSVSMYRPKFYIKEIPENIYIQYPWERNEDDKIKFKKDKNKKENEVRDKALKSGEANFI